MKQVPPSVKPYTSRPCVASCAPASLDNVHAAVQCCRSSVAHCGTCVLAGPGPVDVTNACQPQLVLFVDQRVVTIGTSGVTRALPSVDNMSSIVCTTAASPHSCTVAHECPASIKPYAAPAGMHLQACGAPMQQIISTGGRGDSSPVFCH